MSEIQLAHVEGYSEDIEVPAEKLPAEIQRNHFPLEEYPEIPRVTVLVELPDGNIRIEWGADGTWLLFDAPCLQALPYCKAQCCALRGTVVFPDEMEKNAYEAYWNGEEGGLVLKRDADGACTYLDRPTRLCQIYEERPRTCQDFHCTRDAQARGWKLPNAVFRHSSH